MSETGFHSTSLDEREAAASAPPKITGEQTIRTADTLHAALAGYLERGPEVVLDLSEVDECDTAALQLIYALRLSAVQRKQRFHITAVSPAIASAGAALGLDIDAWTTAHGPAIVGGGREGAGEEHGI